MSDGNGGFARALPAPLEAALRAARAGHHVSFEALRGAVCTYIEELIATGHPDDEIRLRVIGAFQSVGSEAVTEPGSWKDERIDELIALCRDRLTSQA